jgi:hypothetical protein
MIQFDYLSILELCGILFAAFWAVGVFSLWMGCRSARGNFREKGYIRPPSGRAWFPFLLQKRYEAFDDSSIRFFFGISHFCLLVMLLILVIVALLVGSNFLFKNMSGATLGPPPS